MSGYDFKYSRHRTYSKPDGTDDHILIVSLSAALCPCSANEPLSIEPYISGTGACDVSTGGAIDAEKLCCVDDVV